MLDSNFFYNVWEVVKSTDYFLYIFIGGRGCGKTYSTLKGVLEDEECFLYTRRTETEYKNCCSELTNPFKTLNEDLNRNVTIKANKDSAMVIEYLDDERKEFNFIGYASALSTFGKFRGADFSDVNYIIFDEFINTGNVKNFNNEANFLFNMIETVNRNRELLGKESVKVILLSNSNTIDNDIIRTLSLGEEIRKMKESNTELYTDKERGIYLHLINTPGLKDMKEKTRLYRLTKGTSFQDMALENEFVNDYFGDVKKLNYNEFTPVASYEKVTFYKHKSKNLLFASWRKAKCPYYDNLTKKAFKRDYGFMIGNYIERGLILYLDYNVKLFVKKIW